MASRAAHRGRNIAIAIAGQGQHGDQFGIRGLLGLSNPGLQGVEKLFRNHLVVSFS